MAQRRKCPHGLRGRNRHAPDIAWYGTDLGAPQWDDPQARTLCLALDGGVSSPQLGRYGLFIIFHAGLGLQPVRLPAAGAGTRWYRVVDTGLPDGADIADRGQEVALAPADAYLMNPRSTVVLVARAPAAV